MIFSDESQFSLSSNSSSVLVRGLNNQDYDIKRFQPTVKDGGYSVVAWGAIWSDCRSELVDCQGSITYTKYVSVLQEGLLPIFPSGRMIMIESLFMEDEVSFLTAKHKQAWRFKYETKKLPSQRQSPDIRHIEHHRVILGQNILKKNHRPSSNADLL